MVATLSPAIKIEINVIHFNSILSKMGKPGKEGYKENFVCDCKLKSSKKSIRWEFFSLFIKGNLTQHFLPWIIVKNAQN